MIKVGNYYIDSDAIQYKVKTLTSSIDKDGNPIYDVKGYYTHLNFALKRIVEWQTNKAIYEYSDAQLILDKLNEIKKQIDDLDISELKKL